MPKKGKKKKGDEPPPQKPNPWLGEDDATIREAIASMKVKLDKLLLDRNYMQLERDTVATFYDITKKEVEDLEKEVVNKDREMEEMERAHRTAVRVHMQKVKHLEYEHKNRGKAIEADGDAMLAEEREAHLSRDVALKEDKTQLRLELKDQQLGYEVDIRNAKETAAKNLAQLRKQLDRKLDEFRAGLQARLDSLRAELELRRKVEVHEVEERKNLHINDLTRKHERAFAQIRDYYNAITRDNLRLIQRLKGEIASMQQRARDNEAAKSRIAQKNRLLREPLARAVREVAQLQQRLKDHGKDRMALRNARGRLRVVRRAYVELRSAHDKLAAQFAATERERDELYEAFETAVREVRRRGEMRSLALERRLELLQDQFERKQAQFTEVLRAANLDPTVFATVTAKLDEVLEQRGAAIRDLRFHIARVTKARNDAVRAYEARLRQLDVPEEATVALRQLEPTATSTVPAGLVVKPLRTRA